MTNVEGKALASQIERDPFNVRADRPLPSRPLCPLCRGRSAERAARGGGEWVGARAHGGILTQRPRPPREQEETCLCNFVQEHNFRFCRPNEPFVEGSVPCYQLRRVRGGGGGGFGLRSGSDRMGRLRTPGGDRSLFPPPGSPSLSSGSSSGGQSTSRRRPSCGLAAPSSPVSPRSPETPSRTPAAAAAGAWAARDSA